VPAIIAGVIDAIANALLLLGLLLALTAAAMLALA
jgi:hypothetical protein